MNSMILRSAVVAGTLTGGWLAAKLLLRQQRCWSFRDRIVLVTGGSRGLGLLIARELAAEGAQVAICARDGVELAAAAADLRARGGRVMPLVCDLTVADEVESMMSAIADAWGPIEVLINNAGIIQVGPYETMTLDDFREAMALHFWAPLLTTRLALPAMRERGEGRIVNIASIGGRIAVPHLLPYSASKFALVGLSKGLRAELAKENILVTTVCPGLMRTGSHLNARFKGRHREEFTWFSIAGSLPLVSMNADRAARQIISACRFGDAEANLSPLAKIAVRCDALAPELTAELLSLQATLLPGGGGVGTRSRRGSESTSRWSPSLLTRLSDNAAVANNEI